MVTSLCPRCGSPLAEGALAGQCPRCLAALAFGAPVEPESGVLHRAGDLEFLRELGRGGMGVVYEARQVSLNRRVAVKMLPGGVLARPESRSRFRAEAEAAARLRHPNIVTIHEVGELDGQPYFAMELVGGPSLGELVRHQPLAPRRAARYLRLVAEAIAHAHAAGVLHRDLKPSNVLLDERDQPRITDFGLAKLMDSGVDLTRSGELLGSPNYLPPEQVAGDPVGVAGDIYSLGAILYQLLTSRPPFAADSVAATLQQVLHGEPVSPRLLNEAVPIDLETICLACLRREPGRRYAAAGELAADLARFEAGEPVRARRVSRTERLVLWGRRKPALAMLSAALVLTLVVGLTGVLWQWRRAEVSRAEMSRNLYAADVAAAATALAEGNLGRARELLLRHPLPEGVSVPGTEDRLSPDRAAGGRRAAAHEFTWRLLWARCQGDDLAILGTHPWIVTCVAVSPDGRWIASGSQDQPDDVTNSLKLWSLDPGSRGPAPGRPLASSNTVWSVAFTGDSRTLVSAGVGGVRFWDVTTGEARTGFPWVAGQELALAGNVLVASPGHPFFEAAVSAPLVRIDLDTRTARPLAIRGRHPALSPDGRRLAVLDGDRNLQVHDLATERLLFTVATNHLVFRLRFSPTAPGSRVRGR
jgi:predicted Ser/Thr protein kinase